MPNISFDIFYNNDIVNITASRSGAAPRAKPDWKVRRAPKLGPRQVPTPATAFGSRPLRNAESSNRQHHSQLEAGPEIEEIESEAGDERAPKRLTGTPAPKKAGAKGGKKASSTAAATASGPRKLNQDKKTTTTTPPKLNKQKQETSGTKAQAPPKPNKSSA